MDCIFSYSSVGDQTLQMVAHYNIIIPYNQEIQLIKRRMNVYCDARFLVDFSSWKLHSHIKPAKIRHFFEFFSQVLNMLLKTLKN